MAFNLCSAAGTAQINKTTCQHSKKHIHFLLGQSSAGGIKEMLAMAEINYIRHEVNNKDSTYSDVAKRTGRDPRTIKKYAEMEDFNQKPKKMQTRVAPVLGPVKTILDEWIKEDMKKKKKFRRIARKLQGLAKRYLLRGK